LEHHIVGKHYGQNIIFKIIGFPVRILQLLKFLRKKKIDVAISHSSFYSPVVSKLMRVHCIYLNDNEHAKGNLLSFLLADKIMIPEFLNIRKVQKQWAKKSKIFIYPGIKEGVYLWTDYQGKCNYTNNYTKKKKIYIRPEPWTAQYYSGDCNFIDEFLGSVKNIYDIVLLPRGNIQSLHYKKDKFKGITIPEKSIDLKDIIKDCDLFIGAGGTMTREAAVLGIPTISIYQDKLLDVDLYLIKNGLMLHTKALTPQLVSKYLENNQKKQPDLDLVHKGKKAYDMIVKNLLNKRNE
jgi:hypothetical protein